MFKLYKKDRKKYLKELHIHKDLMVLNSETVTIPIHIKWCYCGGLYIMHEKLLPDVNMVKKLSGGVQSELQKWKNMAQTLSQ